MKRSIKISDSSDGLIFAQKGFRYFVVLHGSIEDSHPQDEKEKNGEGEALDKHN